jgi:hypothetical protein
MADIPQVKVLLQEDDRVETLWATPVGRDLYRLDNSPSWAYGISWNDVVEAHLDGEGALRMKRVAEKAGHRTVRVFFPRDEVDSFEAKLILQGVTELGATYEGMNPTYLAIDVPPGVELTAVAQFLSERGVQWEHADPTSADLPPAES